MLVEPTVRVNKGLVNGEGASNPNKSFFSNQKIIKSRNKLMSKFSNYTVNLSIEFYVFKKIITHIFPQCFLL